MPTTEEILKKYGRKIESKIGATRSRGAEQYSQEYISFKKEMTPEISRYERWAKSLGNIFTIKLKEKDRTKVQKHLTSAHIDVTPSQALTLAVLSLFTIFFGTILITVAIFLINGSVQLLFGFLGFLTALFVFYYTYGMPQRLANAWRLQASSQMVPAILYVVVYMKHTSNLERAIGFASEHLQGPLALDFKKIFYDVQIGRFSTIKESLDNYLETWRDAAPEFVESFHLIESSLFEPSEDRRVQTLERSLKVILDGVYEKMLKFSRSIRSPLTNIYMLGIILPTLGLALLPLASALLGGFIKWTHIMILFNILIPFAVFYLTSEVLLKRPGGYGEASVLESNPNYKQYISKKPWIIAALIALPFLLIGLIPFIFQIDFITSALGLQSDYTLGELGLPFLTDIKLFNFLDVGGSRVGPLSPIAAILSLSIPFSVAMFFSIAYRRKTKELIKARDKTKKLEAEFTNTLFQLGNRLGDGLPAEVAFGRVAENTQGLKTQEFFSIVNSNINQQGMSLERAIFDKRRGAIIFFPSTLIATTMRILVESVKKGLKVAAESLTAISQYLKNIQKINLRLRDLLAEIVSDMKSNMTFLAPLLSGIVLGLATMITVILGKLTNLQAGLPAAQQTGFIASVPTIFRVEEIVPPYFLQLAIGFYIVEIIFILTIALVTVDSGKDTLKEKYDLSRYLRSGMILYIITAFLSTVALTVLAGVAVSGIG